jgi:hypothetical protein
MFCPEGLYPQKPDSPVYEIGQSNFFLDSLIQTLDSSSLFQRPKKLDMLETRDENPL